MELAISSIDLTIIVAYLLGVVGFGLWIGRHGRGVADYLVGGRNLPWWAVLFSIVATETSTVTFLSVPGMIYSKQPGNLTFLQLAIGYVLGRHAVVWLLLPLYSRGELYTAYQVLEQQFGGATKQLASFLFIVTRTLADGLRLFLSAIVLQKLTGLDMSVAVIMMGTATIVYTFFGGIRAVVWTDCIQFAVYMLGALAAAIIILTDLPGGVTQVMTYGRQHDCFRLFDFRFDLSQPYLFWAGLLGGAMFSLGSHGADQMMVQRYLCSRNRRDAAWALGLSGYVVFLQFAFFLLLGIGLAAFYQAFPPAAPFEKGDEVFAHFIVHHLPVGIAGITLAAVFSAAMSTLSSSLNSSAATAANDLYLPLARKGVSDQHVLAVTRGLTVFFGVAQIAVGIGGQFLEESVIGAVLAIAAFTTGIILGLFFLGISNRRVGQPAALCALVVGLVVVTVLKFATSLAWPWFVLVGSMITLFAGIVAQSLFFARPKTRIQEGEDDK